MGDLLFLFPSGRCSIVLWRSHHDTAAAKHERAAGRIMNLEAEEKMVRTVVTGLLAVGMLVLMPAKNMAPYRTSLSTPCPESNRGASWYRMERHSVPHAPTRLSSQPPAAGVSAPPKVERSQCCGHRGLRKAFDRIYRMDRGQFSGPLPPQSGARLKHQSQRKSVSPSRPAPTR